MDTKELLATHGVWLLEVSIGIGIILVLSLALKKTVSIIHEKVSTRNGFWKKRIHRILHMPLQIAIWGFGLAFVLDVIATHFGLTALTKYLAPLRVAFIVACFGWVGLRWVKEGFKHLSDKSEKYGVAPGTIYALSKLSSFLVLILVMMIIFRVFGLDIAPLMAFGGIGAAGFAFAAKDIISNFFGGVMLHFTRIFSIGDEVVIPSKEGFEGVVKEIGWYATMIEDYYRRPVYFPNALFSNSQVINESRRSHRRIKETLSIRYEDMPNLEKIIDEIREKIAAHPSVDSKQSFSVSFSGFGQYGLNIFIYILVFRVGYIKFLSIKQELFITIQEIMSKYGAEFCFPTTNINLTQQPPKQ